MNRNKKVKVVSYTLAAGVLVGSASLTADASPLAGATAMVSTNEETVLSNSYSTLAGINLAMSNMVTTANEDASVQVAESGTTATAASQEQDAAKVADTTDYSKIAVSQVTDYVNVRSAASEDSDVVGKLYNNCAATVEATEGEWYKITSGNCSGYVKSQYVVVGDEALAKSVARRVATVTTQTLYVRTEPSTDASVIGMVPNQDDLTVTDESTFNNGWIKVSVEEGEGYVSTDYVSLSTEFNYAESKAEEDARLAAEAAERHAAAAAAAKKTKSSSSSSSSKSYSSASGSGGSSVADYAQQFAGNPYVYGGSSLTNGTDCSGFVMSVYSAYGVSLPHSSSADRSVGYGVSTDEMQSGDIVCYSGHVGIYVGGGQIISASNPSDGIKYNSVNYRNILAVRRIF